MQGERVEVRRLHHRLVHVNHLLTPTAILLAEVGNHQRTVESSSKPPVITSSDGLRGKVLTVEVSLSCPTSSPLCRPLCARGALRGRLSDHQ